MNRFGFVVALALAAVVAVSGEPPVRYRQPFSRGFGRLQQAPVFARQTAGYDYPKPSGYHYPEPEQPFPLPEEPTFTTTVAPTTTVVPTTELPTTTAAVDDYDDNATEDPEAETVEANAVAARLRAARQRSGQRSGQLRQAPRNNRLSARLEALDSQQQDQDQQRPIYLVNIPESTLQRLVLLNQAQAAPVAAAPFAAAVPVAPSAPAQLQYAPLPAAAPLQATAPAAAFPWAGHHQQVYITDAGLVYAGK